MYEYFNEIEMSFLAFFEVENLDLNIQWTYLLYIFG